MLTADRAPRATAADLMLIDDVAGRVRPEDPALDEWFSVYRSTHLRRLSDDLAIVDALAPPTARVLEYGAVPLLLTAALAARGYRVSAVDLAPSRFAGAIARLELDVRCCDVEREAVPFADATFDVVLFNELFEHLRIDPIMTLGEARRVLKPGGIFLLSTPNLRSFRGVRNLLFRDRGHAVSPAGYRQYEKLQAIGHMGHVREYTVTEVVEFLARTGLESTRVWYRGGHGTGAVGMLEHLLPAWRPFFTLIATTSGDPEPPR